MNPDTKTPFIIGVFGRWGTGKTTLMRMLERRLAKHSIATVWFSAWLYNAEEHIWAAFLQSLTNRLANSLPLRDKLLFSMGVYRRGWAWSRLFYEGPKYLAKVLLIAAPVVLASLLASHATSNVAVRLIESSGVAGTVVLAVLSFVAPVWTSIRQNAKPDFSLYKSMDFEEHVGFLDHFRDQFERIVASIPGASRVLVFVDDLDRCGAEKTLQLLDAIKVFLDVKNCIFVLGVDAAVIQRAIAQKYPEDALAQKEYLSKIVQLPFHLPRLTDRDLHEYLRRLDVGFPDERCRGVFLESLSRNPREIKRVINTFSLHWYLALARSLEQNDDITPVRLAKIIVVQQAYPSLFSLLRDQPELLAFMEVQFRRRLGQATPDMPFGAGLNVTQEISPSGISFPPSLAPFTEEPSLIRLLTMHALAPPGDDDASFSALSGDAIQVYFTLTRTNVVPQRSADAASAADRSDPIPVPAARSSAYTDSGDAEMFPDFGDRYLVLRRIGQGGVSEVYAALDRKTGRNVAVKRLLPTLAHDDAWSSRFQRETQITRRVQHANLVGILDIGRGSDEVPFFTVEYLEGVSLREVLNEKRVLRPELSWSLFGPLFDALEFLNQNGIVHRDIKPENIFIGSDGIPKITDLGLAFERSQGRDELTRTGFVVGTPAYISPEQLMDEEVDGRADLFSLGVVIYEALTGKLPFGSGTGASLASRMMLEDPVPPSSISPRLPKSFDRFVARILAKKPADRFWSASEASKAFYDALPQKQRLLLVDLIREIGLRRERA